MTQPAMAPVRPDVPASAPHGLLHRVGEPISFEGYADDFEHAVAGVQFSLDDGVSWTTYPTEGVREDRGVRWTFAYTPRCPAVTCSRPARSTPRERRRRWSRASRSRYSRRRLRVRRRGGAPGGSL